MKKQKTCAQRISRYMQSRMADVHEILKTGTLNGEECSIGDYGLCFDEVKRGDLGNKRPYWRWQFSWGGPQEELRFYEDGPRFAFLDWFDKAEKRLTGTDLETALQAFDEFKGYGAMEKTR